MTKSWMDQKERGSLSLMYFITWLTLKVGYSVGWILLYPICFYFVCFVPKGRAASKQYLEKILERKVGIGAVFRHFHVFSATILDRLFFVSGKLDKYNIDIHGDEIFEKLLTQKKGAILLGAHIGSFEVLRCLARKHPNVRLKVMMYVDNAQSTGAVFQRLNPDLADMVIPLGEINSVMKAKEFIDEGGFVGILGDRITKGDKVVEVDFLDQQASLPLGPHILSTLLEVPVIFFCGLYNHKRHYGVYFESFSNPKHILRKDREQHLHQAVAKYASFLEKYARLSPYNWFNFYRFWL